MCGRCGARLGLGREKASLQSAFALVVTGLCLLVLANVYPIMTFDVAGNTQTNHIFTGVRGLVDQGYAPLALLVFFCAMAAPFVYLTLMLYAITARFLRRPLPGVWGAARLIEVVGPWNLVPVFVVACGVAVVRLELLGKVTWHAGVVFALLLSVCCLVLTQMFDRERIEVLIMEAGGR